MQTLLKLLLITLVAVNTAACSVINVGGGRDVPWDPPQGRALFEQIPAWDGAAGKVCCGHLRECKPHQTPRC